MDLSSFTYIAFAIVSILIALVIHEFMHAYVGYKLGDDTAAVGGRLTLNPIQHIDPFFTLALPIITLILFQTPFLAAKPVPFNPERVKWDEYGAALIAAAGPLTNLLLSFVGALAANLLSVGSSTAAFLEIFTVINVALFVFNSIPIPPLDGSRVLYAFAPEPLQRFMEQMEQYGFFIIILLVLAGGFAFVGSLNQLVLNFLP